MAWIKIRQGEIINANAVKHVIIQMYRDISVSYSIKFYLNGNENFSTKRFEQFEECREVFNRIWSALADGLSVDIS